MRPTMPSRGRDAGLDDLPPDLSFDLPASDFVADVPPERGVDVYPDERFDAAWEGVSDGVRPRRSAKAPTPRATRLETPPAAPVEAPPQRLSLCLACGASPPVGGDCPHDEIANLAEAPAALVAAARKLQALTAELHAQSRALRRRVAAEVGAGRGDLESATRAQTSPGVSVEALAAYAQQHTRQPVRAGRRRGDDGTQSFFAFAAPPPPPEVAPHEDAPRDETSATVVTPEATTTEATAVKPKRGRPRKVVPAPITAEITAEIVAPNE